MQLSRFSLKTRSGNPLVSRPNTRKSLVETLPRNRDASLWSLNRRTAQTHSPVVVHPSSTIPAHRLHPSNPTPPASVADHSAKTRAAPPMQSRSRRQTEPSHVPVFGGFRLNQNNIKHPPIFKPRMTLISRINFSPLTNHFSRPTSPLHHPLEFGVCFLRRNEHFITLRQQSPQLCKLPFASSLHRKLRHPTSSGVCPFLCSPGDTKGDTKFSTVFVSARPMTVGVTNHDKLLVTGFRLGFGKKFLKTGIIADWILDGIDFLGAQ